MPIKKLEGGGYEVRYDTYDAAGTRKQHRRKFDRLKGDNGAEAFAAKQKLSGANESNITIKEYLDGWLLHVKQHRKPQTYAQYREVVEDYFLKRFDGRMKMAKVKRLHIQAVIDKMIAEGFAKNTINGLRRVLSAAMNQAIIDEIIKTNPVKLTRGGGAEPDEIIILDSDEVTLLLDDLRGRDLYMHVFIAANMGLSRGEVAGLRWQDINFESSTLSVFRLKQYVKDEGVLEGTPKTERRRRDLPMPPYVKAELQEEKKRQLKNQVLLGSSYHKSECVCRCCDGTVYHPMSYGYPMRQALKRTGLTLDENGKPHFKFHWLRHSCASLLLDRGVPLTVVSEILGHSNTQITAKAYARALKTSKGLAADAMEKVYGQKK
jgi:integrase